MVQVVLSPEQNYLIELAQQGKNVLVDACIGSGKTTTIQQLCNVLDGKKVLYLTYNKLLKIDAKQKINNYNVMVTNYHGYAASCLWKAGVKCGVSDMIQKFIQLRPERHFDVLILDEYQDIDAEISEMLKIIKEQNPDIQIIAVGDMEQKIYDKTSLDVKTFIEKFLGEGYEQAYFTKCFRISEDHAAYLGRIWKKDIKGVNEDCKVEQMTYKEAYDFLSVQNPEDVLCLGARTGSLSNMLNDLEANFPATYNKHTVYASIRNNESYATEQEIAEKLRDAAIFTTYDSSKGMERSICLVFDFTESYWAMRSSYAEVKYDILRNIFCVAASRGKKHIIFVEDKPSGWQKQRAANLGVSDAEAFLSEKSLSESFDEGHNYRFPFQMSAMFDFKFKEDVEECFSLIKTEKVTDVGDTSIIDIPNYDGFIDLSPCVGIYQEASFFDNYDIQKEVDFINQHKGDRKPLEIKKDDSLDQIILRIVGYETKQNRYVKQVKPPFVTEEQAKLIHNRLKERLTRTETVQVGCNLDFKGEHGKYEVNGKCDVLAGDTVWELKFVSELNHEHFLQCACYVAAFADRGVKHGVLWNVRNNTLYTVTVPDREKFLKAVYKTITKGYEKNGRSVERINLSSILDDSRPW
ncbi:MAG: AAA family ATPase [Clostridia bacterium]|nr:AAA family ATPase [Clostridia bacterium]